MLIVMLKMTRMFKKIPSDLSNLLCVDTFKLFVEHEMKTSESMMLLFLYSYKE